MIAWCERVANRLLVPDDPSAAGELAHEDRQARSRDGTASGLKRTESSPILAHVRRLLLPLVCCASDRQHRSTPSHRLPRRRARAGETALDRYVAAPDPNFAFAKVGDLPPSGGVTATILELTSQQWLTAADVDRPLWKHWLVVYRPERVTSDVGLLWIGGGANNGKLPSTLQRGACASLARDTGTVTAELRMIPNQELTLLSDPERKPRKEDDLIAYTWDKFLRTGDEKWPLRLPMTKAAVRAMDAVTAWSASADGRHAVGAALCRVGRLEARVDDVDDGSRRPARGGHRSCGDRRAQRACRPSSITGARTASGRRPSTTTSRMGSWAGWARLSLRR